MSLFLKYNRPVVERVHGMVPRMARILRAPVVQPNSAAACLLVIIVSSTAFRWRSIADNRRLICFSNCSVVIIV